MRDIIKLILSLFSKKSVQEPEVDDNTPPEIQYKKDSERLRTEYEDLSALNYNLYALIEDLRIFSYDKFGKGLTITMIYRTQEEQDIIYKDDERYKEEKFKSPHQFWHAVDLRSRDFTEEEIKTIETYLNNAYESVNYYDWTAKNHNVGLGDHFHIQLYVE